MGQGFARGSCWGPHHLLCEGGWSLKLSQRTLQSDRAAEKLKQRHTLLVVPYSHEGLGCGAELGVLDNCFLRFLAGQDLGLVGARGNAVG